MKKLVVEISSITKGELVRMVHAMSLMRVPDQQAADEFALAHTEQEIFDIFCFSEEARNMWGDRVTFKSEGLEGTVLPPVIEPPVIPPVVTPPKGEAWVWDQIPVPMVIMDYKGQVKTYIVDVPPGKYKVLGGVVTGLTNETLGHTEWYRPDGTQVFWPDNKVEGNGLLIGAIPVKPLPGQQTVEGGKHVFKIVCERDNSYFKIRVDAHPI